MRESRRRPEWAYYNEIDPFCAQWLRNLIGRGLLMRGDVDERDIREVGADEVRAYRQCHWFAGIGGWGYALRLAGWPDGREVWTGSSPCQDNSVANAIWGERLGLNGERSGLARTWISLIEKAEPRSLFFENVPGIEPWIAQIKGSLEKAGYTVSRQNRSSSSVGAPCLRRRVWLVADRDGKGLERTGETRSSATIGESWRTAPGDLWGRSSGDGSGVVDRVPARMGGVHAFGNSITPQVAAEFIKAYMECAP